MAFGKLERQIVGLVIGFAAKFVTGSLFAFNVYQDALKDTFNYTQKEIEVISSLASVGLGFGFVPGAMFDLYGPQWTSAVGLVISVPGYLLVWSTTRYVDFYTDKSWLVAVYFSLIGFGSAFTAMVSVNTNIVNFSEKYAVIVVGALSAFFAGGPSIFSVIYYKFFVHGDSTNTANHDFPGFMLMFAISFAIVDILCAIFMRIEKQPIVADEHDTNTIAIPTAANISTTFPAIKKPLECPMESNSDVKSQFENPAELSLDQISIKHQTLPNTEISKIGVTNVYYPYCNAPLSLKQLFLNADYHIFVWHVAFSTSIGLVYLNNLTVISKSLNLDRFNNRLTIIIPTVNAIFSLGVGLFSFFFRKSIPKSMIINFACLCLILSQVLVLVYAYHIAVLEVATAIVGGAIGIIWSLVPTVLLEMFYVGNIGRNWGITILVASALGFGTQAIFGALYDGAITTADETHCYGMRCVRGGTIVTVVFGGVALALGVVAQCRRWRRKKYATNS